MIKRAFVGLLLLNAIGIFPQSSDVKVLQDESVVGYNYRQCEDIRAIAYVFPERIEHSYIDSLSGFLTVQLRGLTNNGKWLRNKGNFVLYDIDKKNVRWAKNITYQTTNIQQFGNTIIQSSGNRSFCLDINHGTNLWEVKNDIYFVDPVEKVGLGYKYKTTSGYTNILEGIDLTSGNVIWQRELNREYSWNDVFYLDDTTLMVVAAGLHVLDLNTGTGWDYNTITGIKDYSATIAANTAGMALGLLTGTFMIATGNDLVRDVLSNVVVDNNDIYLASKEKISRIARTSGEILWSYPIFDDMASKSAIFIKDSLLYLVNYGYAYMGYRQLDCGRPFVAAFNKENGRQEFSKVFDAGKSPIMDFQVRKDSLILAFRDKLAILSLENGSIINEKLVNTAEHGELLYFIGNQVYTKSQDSLLTSLRTSDPSKIYAYANQRKILVFDQELSIENVIEFDRLYVYYLRKDDLRFLSKGDQTVVLNNENEIIAEINATRNATLIGEKLYDIQDKSLLEIDISGLMRTD